MHDPDEMVEVGFWDEEPSLNGDAADLYGIRLRADCRPPMQNHLREKFLAAQGPSRSDKAARMKRIENAKRYESWANGRGLGLSSTGQRAL